MDTDWSRGITCPGYWPLIGLAASCQVTTSIMVSTRSSTRPRSQQRETWPVEDSMVDKEVKEDNSEEVAETKSEETEEATSKNELNCKKCDEEKEEGASRGFNRKESKY